MKLKLIDGTVDELFYILQGWNWRIDNNLIIEIDDEIETEPRPEIPPEHCKVLVRDKASDSWEPRTSAGYFDAGWLVCYSLPEGGRNRLWKHWKYDEEVICKDKVDEIYIPPEGVIVWVTDYNYNTWQKTYSTGELDEHGWLKCRKNLDSTDTMSWRNWRPLLPTKGTPILVRDDDASQWNLRNSAGKLDSDGNMLCFLRGTNSGETMSWILWKYPEGDKE